MRIPRTLLALAAVALASAPVGAQQAVEPWHPWAAFFGCWAPVDESTLTLTCVLPVEGAVFEARHVTVIGGNIVRGITLRADGARREVEENGCDVWEAAAFSDDAARVYTRGSARCGTNPEQVNSGVLSITPEGHFLMVAAVRVGEQYSISTQRLGLLRAEEVPAAVQPRLVGVMRMAHGARVLAARPVDLASVEDALRSADARVVEAWMAQTGTGVEKFIVTRRDLERLVAQETPTRIIDMAVVLANPQQFSPVVTRVSSAGNFSGLTSGTAVGTSRRAGVGAGAVCDHTRFGSTFGGSGFPGWAPVLYPGLGFGFYNWLSDCISRSGLFSQWAYGGYGYGSWYGGFFPHQNTVIVRTAPAADSRGLGTVTKGSGYGRSTPSSGVAPAQPRGGTGTVQAGGSSAASSSEGSSTGTRSAGDGGSGRTAQPRKPQ